MTIAALEQALTFISRTDLIASARQQALPNGVTELLKISSGDQECLLAAQESSRHSQEDVRHAAEFYVQQILFAPESDHYRILGVDSDDAEAKIKLHYRLLVRWLHPDKNSSDWEVVFSERINRAWHALRTPERRRQYDEQLSSTQLLSKNLTLSREIKPAQWRESKSDTHFLSARTIKRLPIAVFSVLGLGALLVLWWFSQMQPNLQPVLVAAAEHESAPLPELPAEALVEPVAIPVVENSTISQMNTIAEPASNIAPEQRQDVPAVQVVAAPVQIVKTATPAPAPVLVLKPSAAVTALQNKQKTSEKLKSQLAENEIAAVPDEAKLGNKRGRKTRGNNGIINNQAASKADKALASAAEVLPKLSAAQSDTGSDVLVKQFLQRFSRVYEEGDYFALHNLFTRDLSILGAPPQRTVLRSYRQLFESSESREISLDHVTWLTSDEHIVVIASYQAQVMPRGKGEAQSSRGDIRLDLRVENGQLRIISLQSDIKNG
ncbi:MAG: DnaJ domain-containing protein [Arenimonas sp.]